MDRILGLLLILVVVVPAAVCFFEGIEEALQVAWVILLSCMAGITLTLGAVLLLVGHL